MVRRFAALLAIAAPALGACGEHAPAATTAPATVVRGVALSPNVTCADPECRSYNVVPYVRTRSRYGIGCLGNVPPGTTEPPEPPPQSFATSDIGRPGFPRLRASERGMIRRIQQSVRSKTLRIAWLDGATTPNHFIVFDATDGPCEVWAGGYAVLNGACNEYYQPGENPYRTHPAPDCFATNRPWMRGK